MAELGLKSQQEQQQHRAAGMHIFRVGRAMLCHTGPGGSEDFVAIKKAFMSLISLLFVDMFIGLANKSIWVLSIRCYRKTLH